MSEKDSIIVVDDDPSVLEVTSLLLKESGYEVISCADAEEAISVLESRQVNAVLADIRMPGISGIELASRLGKSNPEMPVVLMTAYADFETAVDAINKGAFSYIVKPFNNEYLIHSLEKAIRYSRLLKMEKHYKESLEQKVKERTDDLSRLSRELIERLISVAEFRDAYTGAHIVRIGRYAGVIASALCLPASIIERISLASSLHDIGKIAVPDKILLKKGALTAEEFEIVKKHTVYGAEILAGSSHPVIQMASSIARSHHERWDGTGYPDGLRGENIPIESRIVFICDHYDALVSCRPYKPSLDHDEAVRIITCGDRKTRPEHFDQAVMKAFIKVAPALKEIFTSCQD